jgi:hypothetical protein
MSVPEVATWAYSTNSIITKTKPIINESRMVPRLTAQVILASAPADGSGAARQPAILPPARRLGSPVQAITA